jgi:hypothetical protein
MNGDASVGADCHRAEKRDVSDDACSWNDAPEQVQILPERLRQMKTKVQERKLPANESRAIFPLREIPLLKELNHSAAKKEGEQK